MYPVYLQGSESKLWIAIVLPTCRFERPTCIQLENTTDRMRSFKLYGLRKVLNMET